MILVLSLMVGNGSRSPTGSMCCSWAWSIWKGRTLSSKAALAFQLLSCTSAGAVPSVLCSEAAPAHVPATIRLLKAGVWLRRGEWSDRRRFITPSWFSIGLLLEGKQGKLVLPSSALFLIHRKKSLRSCPTSLQINTKTYLDAVAGGEYFPLY